MENKNSGESIMTTTKLGVCLGGCRVLQFLEGDSACKICGGGIVVTLEWYLEHERQNDFKNNEELKSHVKEAWSV